MANTNYAVDVRALSNDEFEMALQDRIVQETSDAKNSLEVWAAAAAALLPPTTTNYNCNHNYTQH